MKSLLLIFIALCIVFTTVNAEQILEIPKKPEGYSMGSNTPILHLEAFYDLTCSDCKAAYGIMSTLLKNLIISKNKDLRFTFHVFPIPSHHNAFLFSKGLHAIAKYSNNTQDVWDFINLAFANQDKFYNDATQDLTEAQIVQNFVNLVSSNMPQYNATYFSELLSNPPVAYDTLISSQYANYKTVIWTPTYLANGIQIGGAGGFTYNDWINFIKQFIHIGSESLDLEVQEKEENKVYDFIKLSSNDI